MQIPGISYAAFQLPSDIKTGGVIEHREQQYSYSKLTRARKWRKAFLMVVWWYFVPFNIFKASMQRPGAVLFC